ncbi:hypothetical protein QEN19_003445 [Hanseniaspora menglaensis]
MSHVAKDDIGLLDLEYYHLKHTNGNRSSVDDKVNNEELVPKFIEAIQKQLFQFVVNERKKVLIFKGVDPFVKYVNRKDKSVISAFAAKETQEQKNVDSMLKLNFGNSNLRLDIKKESQYIYKKNLFICLLESMGKINELKSNLKYQDDSDLLTNEKGTIFNNKIWNQNKTKYETRTVSEEINIRIFQMIQEFMKPFMKNKDTANEGFTQILNFNHDEENDFGYDLTLPAFSDNIKQTSIIKSFHCLPVNEFTTKLSCTENLTNNSFLHSLRSKSSSIPYLYPDVVPQDNHFVCFIDINDIEFDRSINLIYSQVGYHDDTITESSEAVIKYDLLYNLRLWDKFNSFEKIEEIFTYYISGLDIHKKVLNDFVIKKVEQFITEMDSWILLKFLNSKMKQNTVIKIKLKDDFKFFSCKILAKLDFKRYYSFLNESSNDISILIKDNNHLAFGNPRQKVVVFKKSISLLLEQDIFFLFKAIKDIITCIEYSNTSSTLKPKKPKCLITKGIEFIKHDTSINQKNRVFKPVTPVKDSATERLKANKNNMFKIEIMSKTDILNIVKKNELKRELQNPTAEDINRIFSIKLREIVKVFKNYDVGNGIGTNVILSRERLYGIMNDGNNLMSGLDLDEFENLLCKLVKNNQLLKFDVGKEEFYRLK